MDIFKRILIMISTFCFSFVIFRFLLLRAVQSLPPRGSTAWGVYTPLGGNKAGVTLCGSLRNAKRFMKRKNKEAGRKEYFLIECPMLNE